MEVKFIEPSVMLERGPIYKQALNTIEKAARTCYKSEDRANPEGTKQFLRRLLKSKHESVFEHASLSVRIICDRGVSHELVRHRLCAFSQESTRYVGYKDKIEFIKPHWVDKESFESPAEERRHLQRLCLLEKTCKDAAKVYRNFLDWGVSKQDARAVLPNALKTELVMTANIREWRYILKLRTGAGAHPDMKIVAGKIKDLFLNEYPVFFEDV